MSKKSKTSSLPTVGGVLEVPKGPALHDDKSENDQSSEEKLRWSTGEISMSQKDEPVDTLETVLTPQRDLSGDVSWRVEGQEITYVREIGKGSFGSVYFATMRGVDVAVKKLFKTEYDDDLIHDFVHEVSMMTKLRHPNVLLFMGACTEPGNLLIVTEFMPRGSVQDVLHDPQLGPRLTFGAKMDIARQTAQGMNWLHLSKPPFLHRDLKPGNLLVDRNWTVKVCDFGLSQVKSNDPAHSTSSPKDDGPVGTPLWMAPEVLAGEECDEASDVYSYGIVLWEIYTRSEPYPDIRSFDELVERVLDKHERPEWPLGAPESLKELTAMCWHKSRKARPSFQEILDSFNDILIEGSLHEKRARRFWSRRLWGREAVAWPQFRDALAAELEAKRRYHMANNPNAHKNHRRHSHRSKVPPAAPRRSAGVSGYDIETHRDDDHRSEASEIDSGATPAPFVHIDGADDTQWRCVLALLLAASPGSADMSSTDGSPSGRSDGAALRRSFSVASMTNSGGVTGSSTRGVAAATSDDTSNILITMEAFGRFLRYAGPFDVNLVERVERLLRQPWFWGDVPTAQAEALVQKHGRGSFLIRFSSSDVGGFSITVLSRSSRIKHYRIAHKDDQFQLGKETRLSLFEIVDEFGDELYMKEACPSSPFQALFEVKLGTELSGYFNVDDFDDGYETRTLSSDNENLS